MGEKCPMDASKTQEDLMKELDIDKNTYIRYKRIEELKAKERQATLTGGSNPQLTKNSSEAEKGEVSQIVAEKTGIGSKDTYRKEKFIVVLTLWKIFHNVKTAAKLRKRKKLVKLPFCIVLFRGIL